ncbi:MAG: glycosyltransferase [Myxococcales bacterium]|nr:glycosyltransferase [Myxococcales bacterium]
MTPAVSVLMPVRDAADTVELAVRSVLGQTLGDLELVVVDDGSRDGSVARVCEAAAGDRRVRVIEQPALGLVAALNRAGSEARAPLLARMDADDESLPRRLERQVAAIRAGGEALAVVSCRVASLGEPLGDGWRRYLAWLDSVRSEEDIARELLVESPLAHPSVLMRRAAFERVGGYRDFDGPEDYDLWLRLAAAGYRFCKVDEMLLRWRDSASRLTREDGRYRPEAFLRCKAEYLARATLARGGAGFARPLVIWGAGRAGRLLGRALEAHGVEIEAFIDIDPNKIGRTRRGRPVHSPEALSDVGLAESFVLAAVPVVGARRLIREHLAGIGRRELDDFVMCA